MQYVAEAPLAKMTQKYWEKIFARDLDTLRLDSLAEAVDKNTPAALDKLRVDLECLAEELGMLRSMVADDVKYLGDSLASGGETRSKLFVRYRGYAKWHYAAVCFPAAPAAWKTGCGKHFAATPFDRRTGEEQPQPACDRCAQFLSRRSAPVATSGSESSSASSS